MKYQPFQVMKNIIMIIDYPLKQFLSIFKINGRYTFHKDLILQLIEKKIKYPDSQIKELSKKRGISSEELRKEIFGIELFYKLNSDLPMIKFKKDIALQLKIIK